MSKFASLLGPWSIVYDAVSKAEGADLAKLEGELQRWLEESEGMLR